MAGVRSYLGAPLIDPNSGMTLGTVCVADQEAQRWGREGAEVVKDLAAEPSERIARGDFQDTTGPGD